MKNKKVIIGIIWIFLFAQAAYCAPPSTQHSAVYYYNLGVKYYSANNYNLALQNYQKAIQLNPKLVEAYNNIIVIYEKKNDSAHLIEYSKKMLKLTPNNENIYFTLAYSYAQLKQYDLAIANYKKALQLKPDFMEAQHNLEVAEYQYSQKSLSSQLNRTVPTQRMPSEIYNLIKMQKGVKYTTFNDLIDILNLLWSDKEGRIFLTQIMEHKVPINIKLGGNNANTTVQSQQYKETISLYGVIPLFSYKAGETKEMSINIGENYIIGFKNQSLPARTRFYDFHVIVHEMGHAAKTFVQPSGKNALQEELTVSMIGYNVASRIFRGRPLSEEETYEYSKECLKALLTDDHRLLPLYNNYPSEITKLGIYPPYPYIYGNLVNIYKDIRNDSDTNRLDSLEQMISPSN